MLRADLDAPNNQRHTAGRVLARLAGEHGAADLSYSGRAASVHLAAVLGFGPRTGLRYAQAGWFRRNHCVPMPSQAR